MSCHSHYFCNFGAGIVPHLYPSLFWMYDDISDVGDDGDNIHCHNWIDSHSAVEVRGHKPVNREYCKTVGQPQVHPSSTIHQTWSEMFAES